MFRTTYGAYLQRLAFYHPPSWYLTPSPPQKSVHLTSRAGTLVTGSSGPTRRSQPRSPNDRLGSGASVHGPSRRGPSGATWPQASPVAEPSPSKATRAHPGRPVPPRPEDADPSDRLWRVDRPGY